MIKFFNRLYLCLLSFFTISFLNGMDFGLGGFDVSYVPTPPSTRVNSSKDVMAMQLEQTPKTQTTTTVFPHKNKSPHIASRTPITSEQYRNNIETLKKLIPIKDELSEFIKLTDDFSQSVLLSEKAAQLKRNLEILTTTDFSAIPLWPEILHKDIIEALHKYEEKNIEKDRTLNTYFISSVKPTSSINHTNRAQIPDSVIYRPSSYPSRPNTIGQTFLALNKAIALNNESMLLQAVYDFMKKNSAHKKFTLPEYYFRIEKTRALQEEKMETLKQKLLTHYIEELTQTYKDSSKISAQLSQSIPIFLNAMYENQHATYNYASELIKGAQRDLITIALYLQEHHPAYDANIHLIYDIITKTSLNNEKISACLMLINDIGNFYSAIQSQEAKIIIDTIAQYYRMLEHQTDGQIQNNINLMVQLLTITTPALEPLFSDLLPMANIPDNQLQKYKAQAYELKVLLEKVNISPITTEKLHTIKNNIESEIAQRLEKAQQEAEKTRLRKIEEAQLREIEDARLLAIQQAQLEAEEKLRAQEAAKREAENARLMAEKIAQEKATGQVNAKDQSASNHVMQTSESQQTEQNPRETAGKEEPLQDPLKNVPQEPADSEIFNSDENGFNKSGQEQHFNLEREKMNLAQERETVQPPTNSITSFLQNSVHYLQEGAQKLSHTIGSWLNWLYEGTVG